MLPDPSFLRLRRFGFYVESGAKEGSLMRQIQHDSYIAGIDDAARLAIVQNALQDRQARLVSWREEAMGGGGSGSELYTVSGEAASGGSVVPWKFILKMFNHEGEGWQEGSTDPMAWNFWKREWLVYQAPWIRELGEGLVTPHCFGVGVLGETAVWVAMEDLTAADQRPWSASRFAASARHLGGFNGRLLVNADPPADSWLSRGWIREWTERAEPMITQLPSLTYHPVVTESRHPPSGCCCRSGNIGTRCTGCSTDFPIRSVIKTCFRVTHSSASPTGRSRPLRSTGRSAAGPPSEPSWRLCSGLPSASSKPIATRPTNWNDCAWTPTSKVCDSPAGMAPVTTSSSGT